MARKLETLKTMYQLKTENCIYFRRQHGQKTKWVSPHEKS